MKQVAIDLGRRRRWQADTVNINATNDDAITVTNNNGVVTVSGLASDVTISDFEASARIMLSSSMANPSQSPIGQTVTSQPRRTGDNTGDDTSTAS